MKDAIVIRNATKQFHKSSVPRQHSTFKTELVRWLRGERRPARDLWIEVLRGIDLTVPAGRTVGIIGRNGAGKSTLLKLMTGIYTPTSGTVTVNGRVSALLDLGAGFHPDFSGRENILINAIILGMSRSEVRARMPDIIAFSELGDFIDEPVRTYSSGMYMRLAFSVATHVDPDILIVDEILGVGDEHFSRKSGAKMDEFKKSGKTIVLVTHNLDAVRNWCEEAAWIDAGRIREIGDPSRVVSEYRQAVALEERQAVSENVSLGSSAPVSIENVRLVGGSPSQAMLVGSQDALEIRIDFTARNENAEVVFRVKLSRSDALVVYETSTLVDGVPLPRPLPASGTLDLQIQRLGLAAGSYWVDVSVESPGGQTYMTRPQACSFQVDSATRLSGVVDLPHRWLLERPAAVQSQVSRTEEAF